jgi:hypothetical protein
MLLAAAFSSVVTAQEGDEYDFSDIPVEEDELPYIGVGAGYTLHVALMDGTDLNKLAADFGFGENALDGPLFVHGGGGWTAIGIIRNVRLGVFGGGGRLETDMIERPIADTVSYKRTLRLTNGYTAALVDYAIPVLPRFTIAPGVMLGGGTTTLTLVQSRENPAFTDFFDTTTYNSDVFNPNRQSTISNSHLFAFPLVSLEYALTQFIMLRVGAGYAMELEFGGDPTWEDEQGHPVSGVPEISAAGFRLHGGLFLGLFQQ